MSKTDDYTKEFVTFYAEIKKEQERYKAIIDLKYSDFAKDWIAKYSPHKVGDVLEITDNKKIRLKRLAIYDLHIQIFDTTPILSAWGWWLDKDNNPVKWGSYPLLNCGTNYKMDLSENQTNISREDYEKQ